MTTIYAKYNHGRWVAICPDHQALGVIIAEEVHPGDAFVCSHDYPDLRAITLIPNPRVKGAFNIIPDAPLREETRARAIADGAAHEVIFPDDWKEIEDVLRLRPVYARNWQPGVTLEELRRENERKLA